MSELALKSELKVAVIVIHYQLTLFAVCSVLAGLPHALAGDAHVVVQRELVAVQHGRPGEAVRLHPPLAACPHSLAEGPAGVDRSLQAHGGEQGAEEQLGVGVALDVQQGDPAHALLGHLVQRVVLHQVRQSHLSVS